MRTAAVLHRTPPRLPRRVAVGLVAIAVLVPLGLWLRTSPLVAASTVEVSGATGPDAPAIRAAAIDAAEGMSTLHPSARRIADALGRWSVVRDVEVHGHFPHTLRVIVHEYDPVAALSFAGHRQAVAADGTLLPDAPTTGLPTVAVHGAPAGRRLTERSALRMVSLLGAAPAALRRHVKRVAAGGDDLSVTLARGPKLYFGSATRLRAKWISVATVLSDRSSAGAQYIDVRVPERPAAGGLEATNPQADVQPSS